MKKIKEANFEVHESEISVVVYFTFFVLQTIKHPSHSFGFFREKGEGGPCEDKWIDKRTNIVLVSLRKFL